MTAVRGRFQCLPVREFTSTHSVTERDISEYLNLASHLLYKFDTAVINLQVKYFLLPVSYFLLSKFVSP